MNRQEAIAVLLEINRECKESIVAMSVSLDTPSDNIFKDGRGYQIRMKFDLDFSSRKCLNPILQRNNLTMKEDNGYVIIQKKI